MSLKPSPDDLDEIERRCEQIRREEAGGTPGGYLAAVRSGGQIVVVPAPDGRPCRYSDAETARLDSQCNFGRGETPMPLVVEHCCDRADPSTWPPELTSLSEAAARGFVAIDDGDDVLLCLPLP